MGFLPHQGVGRGFFYPYLYPNMGRILCIDYGTKKSGIAVTDPLQIIVSGLITVATKDLEAFLIDYLDQEEVEEIVIGYPRYPDGKPAQIAPLVDKFYQNMKKLFTSVRMQLHDERNSTKDAKHILAKSGLPKKKRRNKALVDKISAVLILQDYLSHI